MRKKQIAGLSCFALLFTGFSMAGCATPAPTESKANPPVQAKAPMPLAVRAIIYFHQPTSDNKQLSAALAQACHCTPVFFRAYASDALIYEIALQAGEDFAGFAKTMTQNFSALGIKAVEQDRLMQSQ